jgi:adenylate kinase
MIVVVTGMVGIDKKQYLERVCSLAESAGKDVTLCNIGDMMYAEAPDIAPGRILDIPLKRLNLLRRSVIKDVIAKSKQCDNLIINTHATFRWRHGLFPSFDFDQMRMLNPDIYVCMIDGVDALHYRLVSDHPMNHTLKDLLVWREEEILATELMQQGVNEKAALYSIARGEGDGTARTLYRLMFEQDKKRAYLSFPMTHVMDQPKIMAEISEFRKLMKDTFTCFDPADLEEAYLPSFARDAIANGKKNIELDTLGHKVEFDAEEIVGIESDINSQIYTRDFALIDQAEMIISFIPPFPDGRAAISSGVERELQHAHEAAKEVFVIWTAQHDPSVFVTQTATKVFRDVEKAVAFFKDKGYL